MCHRVRFTLAILLVTLGALTVTAEPFPIVRITNDTSDVLGGGNTFKRDPFTTRGQILFAEADYDVWLFDGTLPPVPVLVQASPGGDDVNDGVFMLGPHSVAGQVLAGWRREFGYGLVSIDGAAPATVTLNPEAVSIADGCIFMVLQNGAQGNHAYQINPATGIHTQLSSGTVGANNGAFRIASSGCKAAWTFIPDIANDPQQIQFWNGTSTVMLEPEASQPRMRGDWIVYSKEVSGIPQVFAVNATDPLLTKVQLSFEDGTKIISNIETDGRHVAWVRSNGDGSGAELVLAGGLVFPTGPLEAFSNERAVQLDRGQLLWMTPDGELYFDDGTITHPIDPSPATTVEVPWLVDGYIAFVGLHEDGGSDKEVFRVEVTAPNDASQPAPPLMVELTAGSGEITVAWDRVLGATAYNLYVANEPGVTKDNYLTLEGGFKVTGVTSPHTLTSLPLNQSYSVAVSAVEGATEGPSSRVASLTLIGNLAWQSVSGMSSFISAAADPDDATLVYAGTGGAIHRSMNGGLTFSEVLGAATTGSNRIAAIAAGTNGVYAAAADGGDIWKSINDGTNWTRVLDATSSGENKASLAIDPQDPDTVFAGDFILPGKTIDDSLVIRTTNGGTTWTHTAEGDDELHAYALAFDSDDPTTLYAGGSGTPNIAKSIDGGATWQSITIPSGGTVHSIAVHPVNHHIVYASMRDKGVFRTRDGGATWTAINSGLDGVVDEFFGGAGFNSLLIHPRDPNYLHLGAGNGYWYSLDGGDSWIAANAGFSTIPEINALTVTDERRLIAATSEGLFLLSVAPAPTVTSVTPSTGDSAGGALVTIAGSGFQSGAVVTFGGEAATGVTIVSSTEITATTPAHTDGGVAVVVTNFDGQSGAKANAFTYTTTPPPMPAGLTATATTSTSVSLVWNATPRATSYAVERQSAGVAFTQIGTSPTPAYTDNSATSAKSYLYRVRAINSAGTSPFSAADIATTVIFTNEPIVANVTTVRAVHISQQRTAINAVRSLAGRSAFAFGTTPVAGDAVLTSHVTQMRTALDEALGDLGRPTGGYTDASLTGKAVKAAHFQELRNRMK